jgi:hypothetical protein
MGATDPRWSRPSHTVTAPLWTHWHIGTVALRNSLDRILEYVNPWGLAARRDSCPSREGIDLRLGTVFHRFLERQVVGRELRMTVNDSPMDPWDPSRTAEPNTESLEIRSELAAVIWEVPDRLSPPARDWRSVCSNVSHVSPEHSACACVKIELFYQEMGG